jgi:hypothetical protein
MNLRVLNSYIVEFLSSTEYYYWVFCATHNGADGTNPHAGSLSPPVLSEVFHELSTAASDI